ncbi:MAG: GTPase Era [Christensenellales bacterium]
MSFKSGFIAVIGCPNVGKSTLVNQMVGQKVSIVSSKPQTTRNRIQSVVTRDGYQMVLLDTPGIHAPKTKLGSYMVKSAMETLKEADAILFVADAKGGIGKRDRALMEQLKASGNHVVLALNKIDILKPEDILKQIDSIKDEAWIEHIVPVSAMTGKNMDHLEEVLKQYLTEGPMYFPKDMVTDQPERFLVAEMVREAALNLLQEEIPHGIGVEVEKMTESKKNNRTVVYVAIYCDKDSHKGMIIGKSGAMLKKIGTQARRQIEWMLGTNVFLEIYVRVKPDWRNSPSLLKQLGYE